MCFHAEPLNGVEGAMCPRRGFPACCLTCGGFCLGSWEDPVICVVMPTFLALSGLLRVFSNLMAWEGRGNEGSKLAVLFRWHGPRKSEYLETFWASFGRLNQDQATRAACELVDLGKLQGIPKASPETRKLHTMPGFSLSHMVECYMCGTNQSKTLIVLRYVFIFRKHCLHSY
jgi:hypothetical protein